MKEVILNKKASTIVEVNDLESETRDKKIIVVATKDKDHQIYILYDPITKDETCYYFLEIRGRFFMTFYGSFKDMISHILKNGYKVYIFNDRKEFGEWLASP